MRIAVVGNGNMGSGFAVALERAGHDVVVGSRSEVPYADAVRGAEVVVVAVPGTALEETLPSIGDLDGKIVVDITNRYVDGGLEGVPARYAHELLQEWAPGARVVKAFNHVGAARLTQPQVGGETPSVLIAGDDVEAKEVVAGLAREIGFEPVDVGPAKAARSLTMLSGALSGLRLGPDRPLRFLGA